MKALLLVAGLMIGFVLTSQAGVVRQVTPPVLKHAAKVSVKVLSYPAKPAKHVARFAWRVLW